MFFYCLLPPLETACFTIFAIIRGKVIFIMGDWRKLHNEELHNLYSSPNIIRMIKSRRMRWAGHVPRMGAKKNANRI
jgi:hypothetical protein